jgi:hypothetical protein
MIEEVKNSARPGSLRKAGYFGLEYRYVAMIPGAINKNDMFQKLNSRSTTPKAGNLVPPDGTARYPDSLGRRRPKPADAILNMLKTNVLRQILDPYLARSREETVLGRDSFKN